MINFPSIKGCEFHEKAVKRIEDAFGNVRWSAVKKAKVTITSEFFGMNGDTASITVTSPSPFAPDPSNPSYKTYTWTVSVADEPNCTIEIPVESTIECYVSRDKANADSYVLLNGVKVVAGEGSYVLTVTTDVTINLADEYSKGDFGKITIVEQGAEITQPAVLKVKKITSDTYAGETTYTGEEFILLDIYPQPYATVYVTYGGVTKKIKDISGAESPNAQQVFFGTLFGETDEKETPASGTLVIKGKIQAFGVGMYSKTSGKGGANYKCNCITGVSAWGGVTYLPDFAFYECDLSSISIPDGVTSIGRSAFYYCHSITSVVVPYGVTDIGDMAFEFCNNLQTITFPETLKTIGKQVVYYANLTEVYKPKKVVVLATTPPTFMPYNGDTTVAMKLVPNDYDTDVNGIIEVPKGCGDAYKAANGWSGHAEQIVEGS